eukprot:4959733-Prymnesium_polylepis.2
MTAEFLRCVRRDWQPAAAAAPRFGPVAALRRELPAPSGVAIAVDPLLFATAIRAPPRDQKLGGARAVSLIDDRGP